MLSSYVLSWNLIACRDTAHTNRVNLSRTIHHVKQSAFLHETQAHMLSCLSRLPPPSRIPEAVKFQRGVWGLEFYVACWRCTWVGHHVEPSAQWYILGRVYGNRSRPRCVRGEAAPCIVSCPRDRRVSRHLCQRESALESRNSHLKVGKHISRVIITIS